MAKKETNKKIKKIDGLRIFDIIIGLLLIIVGTLCFFYSVLLPGAAFLLFIKLLFSGIIKKKINDNSKASMYFIFSILTLVAGVIYTLDRFNIW